MKAKTIRSILRKKHEDWLESIQDEKVRKLAKENTIITGGSIASMLLAEKINDFDVYMRTKEACQALAIYYVEKFKSNPPSQHTGGGEIPISVMDDKDRIKIVVKSAGIASKTGSNNYQYFEADPDADALDATEYVDAAVAVTKDKRELDKKEDKYAPVFLSSNAITLSNKIQVIIRFYGEPDKIHENFDFVHCTNYWDSANDHLELRRDALEALLARDLRYVGSKYPLCSVIRTRKFLKSGWRINAGQYLKMAMQLNDLDLKDPKVLEDQLVGVDVAYFMEIIRKLRDRDPKRVDSAYLLELVDEIF